MIPWIIFAVIVVPLAVLAFMRVRRTTTTAERPLEADDAARARTETEFAEAEAYEDEWRQEHHGDLERKRIP